MLFNIPIPANVLIVNAVFYEIATFDVVPLDWLTDYIDEKFGHLDKNDQVYLSPQALENGYDRTNPIINCIIPLFIIAVSLVILVLTKITSCCGSTLNKLYHKVKKMLVYNSFIRLFNEEFITITLACMIKLYALNFSNWYESLSSAFAIVVIIFAIEFPIAATKFLW